MSVTFCPTALDKLAAVKPQILDTVLIYKVSAPMTILMLVSVHSTGITTLQYRKFCVIPMCGNHFYCSIAFLLKMKL